MAQCIVVGGGLGGLSAAHTILERGGRVLLLEKMAFCGGNSTKATSGINGALTRSQTAKGIGDSAEQFFRDTAKSSLKGEHTENEEYLDPKNNPYLDLNRVLAYNSAPAVHWLQDKFNLDLSLLGRLGGHSFPRTHRGGAKFPGMVITYALMEGLEKVIKEHPGRARLITKAQVTNLIKEGENVIGVEYTKDGKGFKEYGPVVLATGGFGADFTENSILRQVRPEYAHLPTTNGPHNTGDGHKMAMAAGADTLDMKWVQVHPTGLVHPDDPNSKTKWLAAGALRGAGALIFDRDGERFVDELEIRSHVTGKMWDRDKAPYRLVLNGAAGREMDWHCRHYAGRGLMRKVSGPEGLAAEIGCPVSNLRKTLAAYNRSAEKKSDFTGKKFFPACPWSLDDTFYVATITPVIHYTMGGLRMDTESRVLTASGKVIPGLFAAGEVAGGVHGRNRLGGSALLDGVVFGRVAGGSIARYQLGLFSKNGGAARGVSGGVVNLRVDPSSKSVTISFNGAGAGAAAAPADAGETGKIPRDTQYSEESADGDADADGDAKDGELKTYTMAEVAKHTTDDDCWVVVNGQVLNVTKFLDEHPGGKKAIMLYAGKDASEEFNMLHEANVVEKYAPYVLIGTLAADSKL